MPVSETSQEILFSFAVLTVSDKGSRGERQDTSGANLKEIFTELGYRLAAYDIVPDQSAAIANTLVKWVDQLEVDLIITTGGTGVSPSDVTPETTRKVIDKEVPGIGEAMRQASLLKTPNAVLSRGIAGIRKESLIINLPGSKKAAAENIESVIAAIPHALEKIKGSQVDCGS